MNARKIIENYNRFEQNKPAKNADVFNLLTHPLIEKFLTSPTRCYVVLNQRTGKYIYLSTNFEQVIGRPVEEFIKGGVYFMLEEGIKAESKKYVEKAMKAAFDHLQAIKDSKDKTSIVLTYWYEFVKDDGDCHWVYQEAIPIPWQGKLDISHQLVLLSKPAKPPAPNQPYFTLCDFDNEDSSIQWSTFERPDERQQLTRREADVLKCLVSGASAKKIGEKLFIAEATVVTHRRKIINKCGCRNLNELIRFATISGMV